MVTAGGWGHREFMTRGPSFRVERPGVVATTGNSVNVPDATEPCT